MKDALNITLIDTGEHHDSIFTEKMLQLTARGGMKITDQLPTRSCRLRSSEVNYISDWHLAGDPTLIIVQQGTLRIYLRGDVYKDFSAGSYFVAQDNLPADILFDANKHGHRAEVIGNIPLLAVHVKLAHAL